LTQRLLCIFTFTIYVSLSSPQSVSASTTSKFDGQIQPTSNERKLEDANNAKFDYDLSGYSIRFGKCQHVKMFDDQLAEDEESETVLAIKHFVLYRMCPSDDCDDCDENYGEYVVEVEQYLENIAEFYKWDTEIQCEICAQNYYQCNDDNESDSCICDECDNFNNMEDNGYVDATEFIECQKLDVQNQDDGGNGQDDELQLYIGPRCTNDGTRIIIDVFTDENCWEQYEDGDVQSLLGMQLSYIFLRTSYSRNSNDCVSCMEDAYASYEENDRDQQDEDEVLEMCENIYLESAKCETKHGFVNGFMKVNGYENQIQNEYDVCTFIDSLAWGSYDEKGEINVGETQDYIKRYITPLQGGMLLFLSSILLGIGTYAHKLSTYIETTYPNSDFTSHGGVFA